MEAGAKETTSVGLVGVRGGIFFRLVMLLIEGAVRLIMSKFLTFMTSDLRQLFLNELRESSPLVVVTTIATDRCGGLRQGLVML